MPDAFFASTKMRKRKQHTPAVRPSKKPKLAPQPSSSRSKAPADEELASESGGDDDDDLRADDEDPNASAGEEDEAETPAEKRLRLAKLYLESVKAGLADGEYDAAEIDRELVSARLKQDVLEHGGKVHLFVADSFDYGAVHATLRTRGHRFSVTAAVASEDARFLFTAGKEGSIVAWDLCTGARLSTFPKLRPNAQGKGKGKARADGEVKGHTDEVLALAVSGDGRYLASGGKDRKVGVWDVHTREWVKGFSGHRDTISSLAFRKGSQQLYTASYDRTIKLFDLSVMGYVETLFGHQDCVLAVDALRAETALSVGGRDKTARFWKIVDESQLVFRGGGRSSMRELLDGGALEGLEDEAEEGEKKRAPEGERKRFVEGSLECLALVDETTFLTGGDSGSICLWTTQKKKPIFTQAIAHGLHETHSETEGLLKSARWITALGTLRYSDLFASGSWEGQIRLWKLDGKLRTFSLVGTVVAPGVVNSLQMLPAPKGWEAAWAKKKKKGGVVMVAGLGQETRLGRWVTVKGTSGARNGSLVVHIEKSNA